MLVSELALSRALDDCELQPTIVEGLRGCVRLKRLNLVSSITRYPILTLLSYKGLDQGKYLSSEPLA